MILLSFCYFFINIAHAKFYLLKDLFCRSALILNNTMVMPLERSIIFKEFLTIKS